MANQFVQNGAFATPVNIDVGEGAPAALATGIQLAQHKEQIAQQQQQLDLAKQHHKQESLTKWVGIQRNLPFANGQFQKVLQKQANLLAPMFGGPVTSDDNIAAFRNSPQAHSWALGKLLSDPASLGDEDILNEYMKYYQDPAAAEEHLVKIQGMHLLREKNSAMVNLAGQRIGATNARVGQGEKRIETANINATMRDLAPIRGVSFAADKALNLLSKPKVTVGEYKEALLDFSKALTGAGSSAFGREQGLEQAFLTDAERARNLIAKHLSHDPADATVGPGPLKLLRDDLQRLAGAQKAQLQSVLRTHVEARPFTPDTKQKLYKVFGGTPPAAGEASLNLTPSSPAPAGKQASPALVNALKAAPGATDKSVGEYLKSHGYALPGEQ